MVSQSYFIKCIAESEMSRNALNSWEKFKLPPRNNRIENLLDKLRLIRLAERSARD